MTTQNYLEVQSNVVVNCVLWDGNTETWNSPVETIMLVQETTPAIIWTPVTINGVVTDYELSEVIGAGDIGFIWNGTVCTTNQPKPAIPT